MIYIREGKVRVNLTDLCTGQVWGTVHILLQQTDLILSRTLTYVDAFLLSQESLKEVCGLFPTVDIRLRRAQVVMAVWRGICRAKKESYFTMQPMCGKPRPMSRFALAGETNSKSPSQEVQAQVNALKEQVTAMRETEDRAQKIVERQMQ